MENKKMKLSTIVLFILILLSFVAVGVALFKLNESNTKILELNKQIAVINQEKSITSLENTSNTASNNYIAFETNAEKAINNLKTQDGYELIIKREVWLPSEDEGARFGYSGAYVDGEGNAYISLKKDSTLNQKYGAEYKVDNNILNVFVAYNGNGGFSDFIFIKKDGTADKVSTVNGQEIKCEKIEGVKDAITVIPYSEEDKESGIGAYSYLILDINGNVVNK